MDTDICDSLTRGLAKNILIQRAGRGPPLHTPFLIPQNAAMQNWEDFWERYYCMNMGKYVCPMVPVPISKAFAEYYYK